MIATTKRSHDSILQITFFVIGNISEALVSEHGRSRTIVDHFVKRLETINPSLVFAGLFGELEELIILPPLYLYPDFKWISSICRAT